MDEWRCLGCSCTFDGGCELDREIAAMPPLRRYIPPPRLRSPVQGTLTLTRDELNARGRANYRNRIQRSGGTVREKR